MELTAESFQKLNSDLERVQGQVREKEKSQAVDKSKLVALFDKWGVSSLKELRLKRDEIHKSAEEVATQTSQYIQEVSVKLNELETHLVSSGN